jgi:protein-tyrosine phosphatase
VIDLHTHLLPAVDDGSRSVERSLHVLARFAADGVTTVACTPHLRASALRRGLPSRHLAPLAALAALAPPGLALLHGWEILLDEPGAELTAPTLRLGDAPAVLVELPRGPSLPPNIAGELSRIRRSGVLPVVAHPERYAGCTVDDVRGWREAGAVVQGTADALGAPGTRGDAARRLLAAGALDLLASDNHGDARGLAAARTLLDDAGAPDVAALLTLENPARVLRGEPARAVRPVALRVGAWARLARRLRFTRGVGATASPPPHPVPDPEPHAVPLHPHPAP